MSFLGIFNRKANIERTSWEGKKETSPDFPNVSTANHGLSTHLAANGSVTLEKDVNDDDGLEILALEKVGKTKLWGETSYSVKSKGGNIPT